MLFLKSLSMRIDEWSKKNWIIILSLIPPAGMFYILHSVFASKIPAPSVPDSWQHVFSAEFLHAFLARQTPETLARLKLGGLVDSVAPFVYVGTLGLFLSRCFSATLLPRQYWHPTRLVNLLPILTLIFDEIENIGLLLAYHAYPAIHWGGDLAGQITMAKWMTIYIIIVFIATGVIIGVAIWLKGLPTKK